MSVRPSVAPRTGGATMSAVLPACFLCGGQTEVFFELAGVPVHSCRLVADRAQAASFPTGHLRLAVCHGCGFVQNAAFDPALLDYSIDYEETQGCSPTFNSFAGRLARRYVDDYGLHGATILEVGCGKGEFLHHLVELGGSDGLGIDPSWMTGRLPPPSSGRVRFVAELFAPSHSGTPADFVCCRHTLEHIQDVDGFLALLAEAVRPGGVLAIEVPDVVRVLDDLAFWDIYHEHCSYFSLQTLVDAIARRGLAVEHSGIEYAGQYLVAEGRRPAVRSRARATSVERAPGHVHGMVDRARAFGSAIDARLASIRSWFDSCAADGRRVVLWGAGSKAVAFATTLRLSRQVAGAVDINPRKHGKFLPGTGHLVHGPGDLPAIRPDVVVVMNPVYLDEVKAELARAGLQPAVVGVDTLR